MLAYAPLIAVLALGGAMRLFNLSQNGYSREYYAAAVRSMLESWHNVFYNSFDPGGFVTLDKPPVGIWVQALFAKLFGFSALNTLLPQALLGLIAVLLLYLLVRRVFGERAALIAALILALNPGSIAVDRSNNLESCLIVILLTATYFAIRAAETGRLRYLAASMLMVGVGFNVKMAAAWVLAPAIALTYFVFCRQHSLTRQFVHQTAAGALMIALSLSWVAAFDLTPPEYRPYAGSTKNNSMLELVLKHNGKDRFAAVAPAKTSDTNEPQPELYDRSPTGPLRLFRALQAGQFAWFLPLALAGVFLGWRTNSSSRAPRITIAILAGWLASYWLVFSAAGGPFHTYYLATLAPPLAALAGIGVSEAWNRYRSDGAPYFLVALLLSAAAWQGWLFFGQTSASAPYWLITAAAAAMLLVVSTSYGFWTGAIRSHPALTVVPVAAMLMLPLATAASVVLIRPNVLAPVATLAEYTGDHQRTDGARVNPLRRDAARTRLISFLSEQRGQEKFVIAVENAFIAAPIIIATGVPVMTIGGYLGTDPVVTPERIAHFATSGVVRFVMIGGFSLTKRNTSGEIAIRDWVRKNGTPVDADRWSISPLSAGKPYWMRIGGALIELQSPQLYDLRSAARP